MLNILKHRELSRRIAELTEELEELRSEKKQLLAMMDYAEDTGLSTVKKRTFPLWRPILQGWNSRRRNTPPS